MGTRKRRKIWLVVGVLGLVVIGVVVHWMQNPSMTTHPDVVQSPILNVEEARQKLKIKLPDEAVNIQYAGYSEWIAYDFVLKFEAPVDACKKCAIDILGKESENEETVFRELVNPPKSVSLSSELKVDWFDVQNIRSGFLAGNGVKTIWIDSEKGLFYYRDTD